jgi:hypothetical protein
VKTGYPQGDIPRFSVYYPGSWDRERIVPEASSLCLEACGPLYQFSTVILAAVRVNRQQNLGWEVASRAPQALIMSFASIIC